MPFTFIIAGIVLVVAGVRGTDKQLFELLKNDLTGSPSFFPWILSILVIGALGYIPQLRTVSRAFLALLIVVLFLNNRVFFTQFQKAVPEAFKGA